MAACASEGRLHVIGGSPVEREQAKDILKAFESEVTIAPTVRKVYFLEGEDVGLLGDGVLGGYSWDRNVVLVRAGLGSDLEWVLRHEYCHALDDSLGVPSRYADWEPNPDGEGQDETFARLCTLGQVGLSLLDGVGANCMDDALATPLREVASWFREPRWLGEIVGPTRISIERETPSQVIWGINGWVGNQLELSVSDLRFGLAERRLAWYDWENRTWSHQAPSGPVEDAAPAEHRSAYGLDLVYDTLVGRIRLSKIGLPGANVDVVTFGDSFNSSISDCSSNFVLVPGEHILLLTVAGGGAAGFDLTDLQVP